MPSYTGKVISADSHVIEPWDLWAQRVEKAFKDRAPKLERGPDSDTVVVEDVVMPPIGLAAGVFRSDGDVRREGRWEEDVPASAYDPDVRMDILETDGISGEVLYPTLGLMLYPIEDLDFKWALFEAYNGWLAEFCAAHPDRLKGIAMIAHEDPERAAKGIHRARELGLAGAMIPTIAGDAFAPYHSRHYYPMWQAAVDASLPMSIHSATSRERVRKANDTLGVSSAVDEMGVAIPGRNPLSSPLKFELTARVLLGMIFGGVFDAFPDLIFVSAENEAGWAPHLLDRANYEFHRYQNVPRLGFERICVSEPSSYWRTNVKCTFMRDLVAVRTHDLVGTESLMFQTDFPHGVSTYPNSRKMIDELFAGVSDDVLSKIVYQNAADTYGF
jgi:predicted TIM-barrel fold metal-dependent hydrolase